MEQEQLAVRVTDVSLPGIAPLSPCGVLGEEQVEGYVRRLGLRRSEVEAPSLATLQALLRAHVDRVAYETIDLHTGREPPPPALDPRASAQRIISGRGGYCFILVDAFGALLRSLGFRISLHTSNIGSDPEPPERWGNHVVLLVHLDDGRRFVADVGLGDGPTVPFELVPGTWQENGFTFGLEERGQSAWRFIHDPDLGSFKGCTINLGSSAAAVAEFECYHRYYWTSATSTYRTSGVVLQRQCSRGTIEMRSATLRRKHSELPDGGREVLATPQARDEWFSLLSEHFFMGLDDLSEEERATLWENALSAHAAWLEKTGDEKPSA